MLARTARATKAALSSPTSVLSNASTAGRMRSTMARSPGDDCGVMWRSSSTVAITAPHCVWPSTTTSLVP